jgi:hypothetical protein
MKINITLGQRTHEGIVNRQELHEAGYLHGAEGDILLGSVSHLVGGRLRLLPNQ